MLTTSQTGYNTAGQVGTITDQYGGATTNFYDLKGNQIRTTYPDGTEVDTVYDDMGRAIPTTDAFAAGQSPILATRTVWDALGRVTQTQRVGGVVVSTSSPHPPRGEILRLQVLAHAPLRMN